MMKKNMSINVIVAKVVAWKHMFRALDLQVVSTLKHKTNYDSHAILEEFNNNETRAVEALDNYVDHLARGLSLVCNILDPDIIVLRWRHVEYFLYL